jgi:hypothetical protein
VAAAVKGNPPRCGTCLAFVPANLPEEIQDSRARAGLPEPPGRCHLNPKREDTSATDWCLQHRRKP